MASDAPAGAAPIWESGYMVADDAQRQAAEPLHELVFTDRAARPAKWQTRCGRTDVPLERTMTPTPTSYYQVTCAECVRLGEREACARLAEQHKAIWLELVTSDDGVGTWEIREVADLIRARPTP